MIYFQDNIDAKIVVAGLSETCSQKIHNQLVCVNFFIWKSRMQQGIFLCIKVDVLFLLISFFDGLVFTYFIFRKMLRVN